MITSHIPETWRDLQTSVARVLNECGLNATVESRIQTVRGTVEVDVLARESVFGRESLILCECKQWKAHVNQGVVHGFRTVVADSGANLGYLITSSNFQRGAFNAAELTPVRLVTWEDFQLEYQEQWIRVHLYPAMFKEFDAIIQYTEPINSRVHRLYAAATPEKQARFIQLRQRFKGFAWVVLAFYVPHLPKDISPIGGGLTTPHLPLDADVALEGDWAFPTGFFTVSTYREWFEESAAFARLAVAEFEEAIGPLR